MDKAFKDLGKTYLADTEHLHADWELVREYPLSEKLLALSHVWRSPDGGRYVVAAKGAPEAIADLCHLGLDQLGALTAQVEAALPAASGCSPSPGPPSATTRACPPGSTTSTSNISGWPACTTRSVPGWPTRWPNAHEPGCAPS